MRTGTIASAATPAAVTSASVGEAALDQAWRIMRPSCPAPLSEALAHPAWGPCLRGLAVSLCRRQQRLQVQRRRAPVIDIKRAAANDRDD